MRNILIILAAVFGLTAFGATNEPSIQMLATTNGVVKLPTNITSIRIGGTVFTNLLGFGLAVSNNQLSVDTTQLPAGGGSGLITSVSDDFEVTAGDLALTNALGTGPLVRQSAATGVGTVTSVGASTTVSGLGFSGSPITGSGTFSLTGVVAVASGGTGATDASGARSALSLVPGTDVQAYDADLAAVAALANSGIIVRTGAGTVAARTITGDSEAVVSNGDGVSGNPTLSIGSSIARDAEVSAAYQPLDSDLTAVAGVSATGLIARTGSGTASARTITGDSEAVVSNGDGVSGNPTLSIGSAIARDAEVAAGYQPLDSDLTAMAAGTAVATPQTNAVSMGAPTLYVGSTNVAAAIAAITSGGEVNTASNLGTPSATIQGLYDSKSVADLRFRSIEAGSGITLTSNANTVAISSTGGAWDGTPIASGTITNLTVQSFNSRRAFLPAFGGFYADGAFGSVSAPNAFYPLVGAAIASGTSVYDVFANVTEDPYQRILFQSSTTTNSGYRYQVVDSAYLFSGNEYSVTRLYIAQTNKTVLRAGFTDVFTGGASGGAVDGAYLEMSGGLLYGVTANNSSRTTTTTSFTPTMSNTNMVDLEVVVGAGATNVVFNIYTNKVIAWTDSLTNNIPTGSGRYTSAGVVATYSGTPSATSLIYLGAFGVDRSLK